MISHLDAIRFVEEKRKDAVPEWARGDSFLQHLLLTGEIARALAESIGNHNPGLRQYLNPDALGAAGVLHDVGRMLREEQTFHEIAGAEFLRDNARELGLVSESYEARWLADTIRPHFVVREQYEDSLNSPLVAELPTRYSTASLTPLTWAQGVIVCADLTNKGGNQVHYAEKIALVEQNYATSESYRNSNPGLDRAIQQGRDRVSGVCEKVLAASRETLHTMPTTPFM